MMCLEPICMVWRHGMSSCGRRTCLVVGEDYMVMEDVFLLEKTKCSLDMMKHDMIYHDMI